MTKFCTGLGRCTALGIPHGRYEVALVSIYSGYEFLIFSSPHLPPWSYVRSS